MKGLGWVALILLAAVAGGALLLGAFLVLHAASPTVGVVAVVVVMGAPLLYVLGVIVYVEVTTRVRGRRGGEP